MYESADLILHNGQIATMSDAEGIVQALAVTNGIITMTGDDAECLRLRTPETVCVDLSGAFVMPGINDSHCHPDAQAAKSGRWNDLSDLVARDELLEDIRNTPSGDANQQWYLGYRFDETRTDGYPDRNELDRIAPTRPVFILRRDAQVGIVNRAALDRFHRSPLFRDIPDGCVNEKTGRIQGRAVFALSGLIAQSDTVSDYLNGFPSLFDEMARLGITSIHNALTSALAVDAYKALHASQGLPVRIGMVLNGRDQDLVNRTLRSGVHFGNGDEQLYLLGVEYGSDGSTSGRTAAYYRPYTAIEENGVSVSAPNRGNVNFSAAELAENMGRVMAAGLQVTATGNGDRGIDFALDAMQLGLAMHPDAISPRIEHCCCAPPAIQQRMAKLGIINASASGFIYSLGDRYLQNRPAEDIPWLWPHRDMIDQGVLVCGHSDAPVCERNPFFGMWSMVTRKTHSGAVIASEQAISVLEAIRCYTVNPAIAEGKSQHKGTLVRQQLADMIVLDRNLLTVPADDIRDTQVLTTITGGRGVYCAANVAWKTQFTKIEV